ncbi:signal transduction histidine kinase [Clostridium tetanomorphum]|uniref:histidine kinase n=1 Tax=Clostridium tetanomorphum TaxID=1553 RepID=A0A923ECB7_CLOTT|nr:HAMP domain-containing sensor histidine kinase [Clostridium tetanomorphum]KAJ49965.1 integral membrane sensor signal transduction histidine kinase [Clostridium tetanomorphum DSM 665]MBC2399292.1 HAMP domain-containing histidine kinase [Clostridium tetanomorphum]MBP1866096.1 signal transduction histidine kinase [Clostridium tetanomorphum]NRS86724.1 signal transduction histidine kinase [Clostridium tetanomorphum]NRZ99523.1 signal transduction histidine kinase [Clostridium tetanomorphum]
MGKITKKLIKSFFLIISILVFLCFLGSSIFLSKFYVSQQYNGLKNKCTSVYESIKDNVPYKDLDANGFIINNGNVSIIGRGKMGVMSFLHTKGIDTLNEKGKFKNPMNEEFLYYKLDTDIGKIVIFENSKAISEYLKVVYIILISIFLLAMILCIPFISYMGKKFTYPILKLQQASNEIANGNFNIYIDISTKDEMEDLSFSLKNMASKLEKKHSMQRDFIANVSHDFKTPLSIIRNYSEAIIDGLIDADESKKYSKEIIEEVDKLNVLVLDILELSKLQEGAYKLDKSYFSLYTFLSSCINKFIYKAQNKNIIMNLNFQIDNKEIYVYADKVALERVLYNFIDNAIKFSTVNSIIEISSKYNNDDIIVSVKDNGFGIEEKMLDEIWNRYYKHSKSGGMGLGLPICSEILKLHNFEYGVKSIALNGSTFYFVIDKKSIK